MSAQTSATLDALRVLSGMQCGVMPLRLAPPKLTQTCSAVAAAPSSVRRIALRARTTSTSAPANLEPRVRHSRRLQQVAAPRQSRPPSRCALVLSSRRVAEYHNPADARARAHRKPCTGARRHVRARTRNVPRCFSSEEGAQMKSRLEPLLVPCMPNFRCVPLITDDVRRPATVHLRLHATARTASGGVERGAAACGVATLPCQISHSSASSAVAV